MKNLLLCAALLFCAYYFYMNPRTEAPMEPVAVAAPVAPPPAQRVYFHSPLDAPAMLTSESTGMGYYSTDPNSRFTTYKSGFPTYGVAGGAVYVGGSTTNTVIINNAASGRVTTSNASAHRAPSYTAGRFFNAARYPAQNNQRTTN